MPSGSDSCLATPPPRHAARLHRSERSTWRRTNSVTSSKPSEEPACATPSSSSRRTGMRRGEVLGLRWRDVDFDAGDLAIANTVTTAGTSDGRVGPPKTPRSRRTVYVLDDWTFECCASNDKSSRGTTGGRPRMDPSQGLRLPRRTRRLAAPRLGCPGSSISWALKPGYPESDCTTSGTWSATVAFKAGVHPKVVSERLGHATVGVTLDLYSHVTPSIARDAAAWLPRGFGARARFAATNSVATARPRARA